MVSFCGDLAPLRMERSQSWDIYILSMYIVNAVDVINIAEEFRASNIGPDSHLLQYSGRDGLIAFFM